MGRPTETVTAAAASIIGAVCAILLAYGVNVPDAVQDAAIVLVGWLSVAVTWYVARRQRDNVLLPAAKDGTVRRRA